MTEAPRSSGPEESVFRLVVLPNDTVSSEAAFVDVAGRRWYVLDQGLCGSPLTHRSIPASRIPSAGGRIPNPFDPEQPMLDDAGNCVLFVATEIFSNFGAPGLLLDPAD